MVRRFKTRAEAFAGSYENEAFDGGYSVAPASGLDSLQFMAEAPTDAFSQKDEDEVLEGIKQLRAALNGFGGSDVASVEVYLDGTSDTTKKFKILSAGVLRWEIAITADAGSTTGADLEIKAYDDTGSIIGSVFKLVRKAGEAVEFTRAVNTSEEYRVDGVRVLTNRQTGLGGAFGTNTAAATYGANEQDMLQQCWNKCAALDTITRAHGLGTT